MTAPSVAVVTGANRGIGFEICHQLGELGWTVVCTARDGRKAEEACAKLRALVPGGEFVPQILDVTSQTQALTVAAFCKTRFGSVQALINNAGRVLDDHRDPRTLVTDPTVLARTFDTNTISVLRLVQAFDELLTPGANVVNVSSGMGALADMGPAYPAYRISKAAMNALTILLHHELSARGVKCNAVCPGWVKTPLGGPGATREVADGAKGVVWAATLPPDGPSGCFFRDGEELHW